MGYSEIRKSIKANARETLKQNNTTLIVANILFGIMTFIPAFVQESIIHSYSSLFIFTFIQLIIATPLYVGVMMMNMACIRGEEIKVTDIFKGFGRLYAVYGTNLLRAAIIALLTTPLLLVPLTMSKDPFLVPLMVSTITFISNLIFGTIFAQVDNIVADEKDVNIIEAIKQSINLMKGHFIEYIVFDLSLIGWILLVIVTFGIAAIWVIPYINLCYVYFYKYLREEKTVEYKTTNHKGIVIGIAMGVLLAGFVVGEGVFNSWSLSPRVVKDFLSENNLKLMDISSEAVYFLSDEENARYKIDPNEMTGFMYERHTMVVKNHPLDSKKEDKIKNTIVYILVNNDKIVGVSCEPLESSMIAKNEISTLGNYDIKGNLVK